MDWIKNIFSYYFVPFQNAYMHIKKNLRSLDKIGQKSYLRKNSRLNPLNEEVYRIYVPDCKISWSSIWPPYMPIEYTSKKVLRGPKWADNQDPTLIKNWNKQDGLIDRRSVMGEYSVIGGRPINIKGRTGVSGRGCLGRWGPNHAVDPVVTRWQKNEAGERVLHEEDGKPILEFVAIKRKDTDDWAIPGGMCDKGEIPMDALKREFMEEAMDSLGKNQIESTEIENRLKKLFESGKEIYKGYVEDPRNTDNAWIETTVYNFHDDDGKVLDNMELTAGDDAIQVEWKVIDKNLKLYANHRNFIEMVTEKLDSHW